MPPTGARVDPPLAHNFTVTLADSAGAGAIPAGGFTECTGIEMSLDVQEYTEGGNNGTVLKFPTRIKWANITLKTGIGHSDELWNWHYGFVLGTGSRRDGVITLLDGAGRPVSAWAFRRGLPVRYTGPSFNAGQSNVAIEAIEIAHEGLLRVR